MPTAARDLPSADFIHPSFGRAMDVRSVDTFGLTDDAITSKTIGIMGDLVREDSDHSPRIAAAAEEATRGLSPGAGEREEIDAVYWYVKNSVAYIGDEQQIEPFDFFFNPDELLIRPSALISMPRPMDDCDGFTMLICALLRRLGYKTFFKTVAADPKRPSYYTHVYALALTSRNERIPLDASHGPGPGVEVRPVFKSRVWPVDGTPMSFTIRKPLNPRAAQHIRNRLAGLSEGDEDSPWYMDIINKSFDIAKPILTNRYGTPEGGYIQRTTGKAGTSEIISGAGAGVPVGTGLSTSTVMVIGGVIVAAMVLSNSRR